MRILTLPVVLACALALGTLCPGRAAAEMPRGPVLQSRLMQSGSIQPTVFSPAARIFASAADPGLQCRQAVRAAERAAGVPAQLMAAIGRVESGRPDAQGVYHPWPWTINVEGEGHFYNSKAEAIAAVQGFQARGARSIDVGCMQVNLLYHPNAFASLDQAFDPIVNARYAASFLTTLRAQTGSWEGATAAYHSANPVLGEPYQRKVASVLPEEMRKIGMTPDGPPGGNVWSTNVWSANVWNASPTLQAGVLQRGVLQRGILQAGLQLAGRAQLAAATGVSPIGGGYMLNNRADAARVLPAAAGTIGRGLAAYRTAPIPVSSGPLGGARPVASASSAPAGDRAPLQAELGANRLRM